MISNKLESMIPTSVLKLEHSAFEFYATGSRFFGNQVTESSDWDFFAENSNEIQIFLEDLGFKLVSESNNYACDETIANVYRYVPVVSDKGLTQLDVQLIHRNQFRNKIATQTFLKKFFKENGIPGDKSIRNVFWDLVSEALKQRA